MLLLQWSISMASPDAVTVTRTIAYSSCMAKTFHQLRLDDEITDFTIVSGKQSFNCHRVILAGSSPVLQAMVRSGMKEALENKANIDTIPSAVMPLILDYIYTGEVVIPHEHLQKTIEAADYLQLLELKEICVGDANTALKPSNIVSWYKFADGLDIEELKLKCAEVMSSCIAEVSRFAEFQELNFAEVNSFMSSARETDADPDDLLEASMEWINSKPSQRIDCMEELLQKVQLLECSLECLENEMGTHEALFMSSPAGYRLISKALLQFSKQAGMRQKRGTKRKSQTMLVVIGGQQEYSQGLNKVCWKLNASLQLEKLCEIPDHSLRFGVCKIPGGFALTGGEDSTICSMYVLSTNSWKQLKAMKTMRCNHGSIFISGRIFVLGGGRAHISKSASVHSLALDGDNWTEEADIPIKVHYPEVANVEDSIFLLDGYSIQLFRLDTKTNTWSRRKNPPCCWGARMVVVNGQLLVAGSNYKIAAQYDPKTDMWCTLDSPTLNHWFGALVGLENKLFLIGGRYEDGIEEYNFDTANWSVCDIRFQKELFNLRALTLDF